MSNHISDEMLRLEALKIAVQTLSPNSGHESGLIMLAKEIFDYIKTGVYKENIVKS